MTLVTWLQSLDGVTDVYAVKIHIRHQTFEGASYVQDGEQRFYVLGSLPKCYLRRKATCFTLEGREWYVAGYWQEEGTNYCHPFGRYWLCFRWSSDQAIDEGERYAYRRHEMIIDNSNS
jgi:hypothetical protein